MTAGVAVSAAVFAIDKPYSYKIPDGMRVLAGMRVMVPFGRGNRRCEGIVLQTAEGDDAKLKPIERVLDEEPVLDERRLRLAAFIRERCFCTFYEAARAILPAGLWFRATEVYAIRPSAGDWRAVLEKNEAALRVMQLMEDLGGSAELPALRAQLPDAEELQAALKYLSGKKLITSNLDLTQRAGSKTERFASLAVSADEAAEYAARKQRSAPLQKNVLELLCAIESASCREICCLTGASGATLKRLEAVGLLTITEREVMRTAVRPSGGQVQPPPVLSAEQQGVYEGLRAQMAQERPGTALLYGVTGSGKTAVYIRLIRDVLDAGRSAVLLVPEIALTPQLLGKLTAHFGDEVALLHSSLRVGERYDEWRRVRDGRAHVVVGTRSAIFAPVQNAGLYIVDEEQEHTYKSENNPRYHAREAAIFRGYQDRALVLLGSATPSVESMYQAKNGVYSLYTMTQRYNGRSLPRAELVDMRQEMKNGNPTSISRELEERIRDNILDGRQSILFLNRRGNSRYLICVECGEVPTCPRCSVPLTYHSANRRLMCHYCGYSQPIPARCPKCGGPFKPVGTGTQKVEQELAAIFPDTRVLRMDADTVSAANTHEAILGRFERERVPVLLGTQMVAKGLDFENVTLVGVLDADMSLYVDNFRAAETTFSLLTQVVGRAGRGSAAGIAVIQTMNPEHPVVRLAAEQDYDGFYALEIGIRQLRRFPPFSDLFLLSFTGVQEDLVMRAAARFRAALAESLQKSAGLEDAVLLGPAPAPVVKVNYTYRYRLTLACRNTREVRQLLSYHLREFARDKQNRGVSAFADVNSYD